MAPKLRVLTDQQRAALAEGALRLLADVGVRLIEPAARGMLRDAGARLAGDRVFLPVELVQRLLARAPASVMVFGRASEPALHLTRRNIYFGAHVDAPDVLDPTTGERRPCIMADVRRHAALIHALPNIGTAGTSDAQGFDGQAIMEAATSCLLAAASGAHLIHDVGLLGSATVVVPEMIVVTDEIVA